CRSSPRLLRALLLAAPGESASAALPCGAAAFSRARAALTSALGIDADRRGLLLRVPCAAGEARCSLRLGACSRRCVFTGSHGARGLRVQRLLAASARPSAVLVRPAGPRACASLL